MTIFQYIVALFLPLHGLISAAIAFVGWKFGIF